MAFIGSGYVDDVACVAKYRVAMNIWASNHPWVHTTISACQCYRLCSEKKIKNPAQTGFLRMSMSLVSPVVYRMGRRIRYSYVGR